jgi:hypothetical protein
MYPPLAYLIVILCLAAAGFSGVKFIEATVKGNWPIWVSLLAFFGVCLVLAIICAVVNPAMA